MTATQRLELIAAIEAQFRQHGCPACRTKTLCEAGECEACDALWCMLEDDPSWDDGDPSWLFALQRDFAALEAPP